ncbi:MAG: hypothetical protein GY841_05670 [FCB group bacterium]|nr:hypothetical protein [FCB group bacterium]
MAAALALAFCLMVFIGCSSLATQKGFYEPITAELRASNFEAALDSLEAARLKNKFADKDRFLYFIDAGLANHFANRLDSSNIKLTLAEDAAEELFTKSISRAAASMLLNDNVLVYAGEDYEILYTNLFKALNYIALNEFDDAFVEIRRANEKLELLEYKYRQAADNLNEGMGDEDDSNRVEIEYEAKDVRFNNDAFARYLSMHIYAADGKYDDARIDHELMQRAFREQPQIYDFALPKVKYRSKNKSILSIVSLVGLSPVKEALNLRIRTDKDLDLVQVLYTDPERKDSEYGHLPMPISQDYYFKLSIPEITPRPSIINQIQISIDGQSVGRLQLIENIGRVATETFEAKKSLIYLRTVARAIVKGLAAHKAKKKADSGGAGGWLKKLAIDVATDITENADLRCSRLLPGRIYIGDFEIDPGVYDITIEYLDGNGNVVNSEVIEDYKVLKRGLNLVESIALN